MGLAFYFYFLFFIIIIIFFLKKNNFHWRQDQRILMTEDSPLLFACNDHEWFVRERRIWPLVFKIVTKMPSKYLPKKKKSPKKLKQKKHKMKIKIRLELYSKNCFAQYIWRHIFFLNGFWKLFVEQLQYVWKLPHFVLKTKNCP